MDIVLWVVQGLLALAFIFSGASKAFMPLANVKKNFDWANHVPGWLVRFIGASELLGGIGLVLPPVTHILPWLAIAAGIGLAIVMICAAVFHASRREFSSIGFNAILLILVLFIVIGRLVVPFPA